MLDSLFRQEKTTRRNNFYKYTFGWILVNCTACAGSGYYDHNGSPLCGSCDGSGKERRRGPKALLHLEEKIKIGEYNE